MKKNRYYDLLIITRLHMSQKIQLILPEQTNQLVSGHFHNDYTLYVSYTMGTTYAQEYRN